MREDPQGGTALREYVGVGTPRIDYRRQPQRGELSGSERVNKVPSTKVPVSDRGEGIRLNHVGGSKTELKWRAVGMGSEYLS